MGFDATCDIQLDFDKLIDKRLLVRRITIDVNHVKCEKDVENEARQLSLFEKIDVSEDSAKEDRTNEAILTIKKRYGTNAILKGINYEEGATGRERNAQIGGHRA